MRMTKFSLSKGTRQSSRPHNNMELGSGTGRKSKMKLPVSCGTKVECTIPDRLQGECSSSDKHKTQLEMKLET
jgi:hypothetical protein